mgnify:CR=1 FL=1
MEEANRGCTPEETIEALMQRHSTAILRTCYVMLKDAHLAEDAMQETFVKAYKALSSFRGDSRTETWLMRIAINTCKDMLRGRWFRFVDRRKALEDLPEASVPFEVNDDTLIKEVMALPSKYRAAILMTYYWNLPATEAAEALGIASSTLYVYVSRARKMLKTRLEGWYDEA